VRIQHQAGVEPVLRAVEAEAARRSARAFSVGGYVRDRVMGRPCTDIDVVVENGQGLEVAEAVATRLGASPPVRFDRFGTAQLAYGDILVEFVSARAESYAEDSRKPFVREATLDEDVRRRDFTCNTLLADADGDVTDLLGLGLADIDAKLLRTPLPASETFAEDPLRAVRAVRFAVTLGFRMDAEIMPAIRANLDRLQDVVSVERVSVELRKMLLSDRPGDAFRLMRESGILARLMPEVEAMAGVEQSGFHSHDVLDHTLHALDACAARGRGASPPEELVLRLAVLLHDVGKPATAARDGDRITFLGHPEEGVRLATAMLRRLRFSNAEIEAVARLVAMHMRPIQYDPEGWGDAAVRRLVRDAEEGLDALLDLADADMAASAYPPEDAARKVGDLRRRIGALDVDAVRALRPPLDGDTLMQRFGRPAGPWVGRVQRALLEAVLDGDLPTGDAGVAAAWAWLEARPELLRDA